MAAKVKRHEFLANFSFVNTRDNQRRLAEKRDQDMAKKFRMTAARRFEGRIWPIFLRIGLAPAGIFMLTVKGRKSGKPHSTPVEPIVVGGKRYLVAPYGVVQWVRNARVAGWVSLARAGKSEAVKIEEAAPSEAAPVLLAYRTRGKYSGAYWDVTPNSPPEAFVAAAPHHPVFRIVGPYVGGTDKT